MSPYYITAGAMIGLQTVFLVLLVLVLYRQNIMRADIVKLSPFWKTFQTKVVAKLHHPHPESQELDRLMEKLEALTLEPEEKRELKSLLRAKANDDSSEERDLAQMLLLAIPRVSRERGEPPTPVNGIKLNHLN